MATLAPNMNYMHQPGNGLGVFCPTYSPETMPQFMPPPGLGGYYGAPAQPAQQHYAPQRSPALPQQQQWASLVASVVGEVIEEVNTNTPLDYNANQNNDDYTYDVSCAPCRAPGWSKDTRKNSISFITSKFPAPDASSDTVDTETGSQSGSQNGSQTSSEPKFHISAECCNPGSVGHPDFCSRSCHYFAAGTCSKGEACQFCHMSHRKRPMRLDKANRSQLRNMSFEERANLILPIMKKKAQAFGLSMEPLTHLEKCIALEYPIDQVSLDKMRAKSNHKVFKDVLKVGNMNSFVKLLLDADLSPAIMAALDQACAVWTSKSLTSDDV